MKKLIISAGILLASSQCYSQLYIGVSDKDIVAYFPKAEVHKVKVRDSIVVLVLADDAKSMFWYDTHRQMVTSYQVNPVDRGLYVQLTEGLDKNCFIVKPTQEWSCKKGDYIIKVTKKLVEGKNGVMVETLDYELK